MEATEACLEMTKRQFEEQLARETAGITGLKTTIVARQTEIRQLKTRITEVRKLIENFYHFISTSYPLVRLNGSVCFSFVSFIFVYLPKALL